MHEGLFKKHLQQILSRTNAKQEIIFLLKEQTGIDISEDEIILSKKTINFSTSSVKKAHLLQKRSKELLAKIGYTLKF